MSKATEEEEKDIEPEKPQPEKPGDKPTQPQAYWPWPPLP